MKLEESFSFQIRPTPPYDFKLTVRKPAGWSLFNSQEIFENNVLWSAARIGGKLAGLKIKSLGDVERPRILTTVFTKEAVPSRERAEFSKALEALLGANDDLNEFYAFATKDSILRHAVQDLNGMHDTQPGSLFNSVVLSI